MFVDLDEDVLLFQDKKFVLCYSPETGIITVAVVCN